MLQGVYMKIFITGEKGFIGRNLVKKLNDFGMTHIPSGKNYITKMIYHKDEELCIYQNNIDSWVEFFYENNVEIIIHNAATVGTDVVALYPNESTLTNITGTYNICRAAKRLGIPVCYMGTTVIYDVAKYQDSLITEKSEKSPLTLYGCQKLCAEDIVKSQTGNRWMIIRPLFAYGGEGDMNSLIAKTIYGHLKNHNNIDMFLNKEKIKDYMHVDDYCDAVLLAIKNNLWNNDWNISAETPLNTGEIITLLENFLFKETGFQKNVLTWHPETDYLGNHRLSSLKFRETTGWSPKIQIEEGIKRTIKEIKESVDYNPLIYLEKAKQNNIDLTDFYKN
jgi:dTDP-glucose 4,6-dehydratase